MDILITTPFHPAYMTPERLGRAKKLTLAHTAGVGSDHINLPAAADLGITVTEVSGSNTSSVAEDELLRILLLLRNFLPAHQQITDGGWDVAACAAQAYDLKDKVVATVGAGRIGYELLKRLKPFECKELIYWDRLPMNKERQAETGAKRMEDFDALLAKSDVVVVNVPLTVQTT
jgi:formate dehydrogenase